MTVNITYDALVELYGQPQNTTVYLQYIDPFNKFLDQYQINTPQRIAMFFGQVGVESVKLTATVGNFNYAAARLVQVFPHIFPTLEEAQPYDHNPEKIVNHIYCNKMGNGPEDSGDAWTYRERGLIQLCGKDNYVNFAKYKKMSVVDVITYLGTPDGVVEVACWFWQVGKINKFADKDDIKGATKVINTGLLGLDLRTAMYEKALTVFT